MVRNRTRALYLAGIGAITAWTGCGSAPTGPALTPSERATIRDDTQQNGVLTVALRVTLDAPDATDRVHLHAVTYDLDGHETTTDLGEYIGTVTQEASTGDDLLRVTIEHENQRRSIRLVQHDSFLDAEELDDGNATDPVRLLRHIELPNGIRVQPSATPVETPR
jgi:hypothetical protein